MGTYYCELSDIIKRLKLHEVSEPEMLSEGSPQSNCGDRGSYISVELHDNKASSQEFKSHGLSWRHVSIERDFS